MPKYMSPVFDETKSELYKLFQVWIESVRSTEGEHPSNRMSYSQIRETLSESVDQSGSTARIVIFDSLTKIEETQPGG